MVFGISAETPRETQCTILCGCTFLSLTCTFRACIFIRVYFFLLLLMGKAIQQGTSAVVIRRAVIKASAREGFHTKFVSKFYF